MSSFWKGLLYRLTVCSLTICIFRFGFEGGVWVLISQVPGHCILVTCVAAKAVFGLTLSQTS